MLKQYAIEDLKAGMNLEGFDKSFVPAAEDYTLADRWILSRYAKTARDVTENLEKFELGEAGRMLLWFLCALAAVIEKKM